MKPPDHYQVLGVHPCATIEQIKAAYRRQALKHHPDKNPDRPAAADQFKLCNDAYAALSSPKRRQEYDRKQARPGLPDLVGGLVDDLMGKRRRRRVPGREVRCSVTVSLSEAALGVRRRVAFTALHSCPKCAGGGAAPGGTQTCPACRGKGEVRDREGLLSLPHPCARCGGQGVSVSEPCKPCGGVGTVERPREYLVRLPPGVAAGDVKVIEGQGEPGLEGGPPGDLLIRVDVERDPLFRRDGVDLLLELPITIGQAALGGTIEVPTLQGLVKMKVPPGTQTGRTFRLRGQGVRRQDQPGDLLVTVAVETPVFLDQQQRELIEQLEAGCDDAMLPRRRRFQQAVAELRPGRKARGELGS